jgi:4-amino-4-deoxy-L-arabinose transferase-like glycosyltransferase
LTAKKDAGILFSHILLIYLFSRLLLEAVGLLSLFYFPSARALFPMKDLLYHQPVAPSAEIWARWDSEWYLLMADHGYDSYEYFKEQGGGRYRPTDIAKFPLYPWTVRLFSFFTGNSVYAGLIVSNLAAVLFFYYFYRLAERLLGSENGAQACLFYIFFPTSFFFNTVYTESLFLASMVAAFFYLESKKLLPAAVSAALAVLCRSTGLLALPALVWLAILRFPDRKLSSSLSIIFACLFSFSIYLVVIWKSFGNLDAVIAGPDYWRGQTSYPFYALVRFLSNPVSIHGQHNSIIDFSFAFVHLAALVISFRRLPVPYFVYSIIVIVFPLSSSLFSFSRLCLLNFPFFLFLGSQLSGRWSLIVQTMFAMLLAFFMAAFANWYWVG